MIKHLAAGSLLAAGIIFWMMEGNGQAVFSKLPQAIVKLKQTNTNQSSAPDTRIEEISIKAGNPLVEFEPLGGIQGRTKLDEILLSGVPETPQSYEAIQELLRRGVSADERVALSRILGGLHSSRNGTQNNSNILETLQRMTSDENKEVARMAAITHARTGYSSSSVKILDEMLLRKVFSEDDYHGELAHLLQIAPREQYADLMKRLVAGKNQYATDIISNALGGDTELLSRFEPLERERLGVLLSQTEPGFPTATGEFGLFDAMRYTAWLKASALVETKGDAHLLESYFMEKLGTPGTDPRKIIAFLVLPEGSSVLSKAQLASPAGGLAEIALHYAAQYPSSASLRSASEQLRHQMGRR